MWCSRLLLLLCALSTKFHVDAKYLNASSNREDEIVYQKYVELDKNLKEFINRGVKLLLPYVMQANEHLNLSSRCKRDVFQLVSGIRKLKLSPLKILDAAGKVSAGLLTGSVQMLGDFDECMTTRNLREDGNITFKGQYCLIQLRPFTPKKKRIFTLDSGFKDLVEATKNTSEAIQFLASTVHMLYANPIKFGLCVPSGCSDKDVSLIVRYVGDKAYVNSTVEHCDQESDLPVYLEKKIAIIVFSVVGLLSLIGTCMDYYYRKKDICFKSTNIRLLLCFSILTNFPKLINTKVSDKSLSSLFGVRSLSVFYVILMHHYYFIGTFQIQAHGFRISENVGEFIFQIVTNGFLITEVFFFLGGLLNIYNRMNMHESDKGKLSFIKIIIHRLWRIYPTYVFSLLTAFLFSDVDGPLAFRTRKEFLSNCQNYWWQNLLFINNFFDQENTCMPHTWYIASDMHLFMISLFTVPVLLRSAKRGIILHIAVLVSGLTATMLWAWHKDLTPTTVFYRLEMDEILRVRNAYSSILPHIAPYFTGLLTGYMLSVWKDFKIPLVYQFLGWSVAAVSFTSMIFISKTWNSGAEFTLVESVLYFGFCRLLYVLAVAWLVVCCARGYGGIVNYILSLKIWIPICRISYMMYMISPLLQLFYFSNSRVAIDYHRMVLVWQYMGDLGISALMALAMAAVAESPFIAMEKVLLGRKTIREEENLENYIERENEITDKSTESNIEIHQNIKSSFGNNLLKK